MKELLLHEWGNSYLYLSMICTKYPMHEKLWYMNNRKKLLHNNNNNNNNQIVLFQRKQLTSNHTSSNLTYLAPLWPWKLGQGHQNLLKSCYNHVKFDSNPPASSGDVLHIQKSVMPKLRDLHQKQCPPLLWWGHILIYRISKIVRKPCFCCMLTTKAQAPWI